MVFLGLSSRQSVAPEEAVPTTVPPCGRLAAFRQLASSLQQPEDHKGCTVTSEFGSFVCAPSPSRVVGPGPVNCRKPCEGQLLDATCNLNFSLASAEDGSKSPRRSSSPFKLSQAKRLAKSLPRLILPGQSTPPEPPAAEVASGLLAVQVPKAQSPASDLAQHEARVVELKGKAQLHATARLRGTHLFLLQDGDDKPYRIEDVHCSTVVEQPGGVVQVEGPYCVLTRIQFETGATAHQWVEGLQLAARHPSGAPGSSNAVEKFGPLVKVKDTMFGNRSVFARLADRHLKLYSSATSQTPYRVEDLRGAAVKMADTCFFLEGPYCLPGIFKLGNTAQTLDWVEALQCAIGGLDATSPMTCVIGTPEDIGGGAFADRLARQMKVLQETAATAPAAKQPDILWLLAKFQVQLAAEVGKPPVSSSKPQPPAFCLAPGGLRTSASY